jgi:hypothetical protein
VSLTYSPEQVHPEHGPLCYLCDIEDVAAVSETPRSQTVVTVETVAEVEPTVVQLCRVIQFGAVYSSNRLAC